MRAGRQPGHGDRMRGRGRGCSGQERRHVQGSANGAAQMPWVTTDACTVTSGDICHRAEAPNPWLGPTAPTRAPSHPEDGGRQPPPQPHPGTDQLSDVPRARGRAWPAAPRHAQQCVVPKAAEPLHGWPDPLVQSPCPTYLLTLRQLRPPGQGPRDQSCLPAVPLRSAPE